MALFQDYPGEPVLLADLDFTEARDSEWQWHKLGHMQVCTSLQTDNQWRRHRVDWGWTCAPHFCYRSLLKLIQIWHEFLQGEGSIRSAPPPDPRYRLALCARHVCPPHIFWPGDAPADNHACTPPLSIYRLDALPAAQPTASRHWRTKHWRIDNIQLLTDNKQDVNTKIHYTQERMLTCISLLQVQSLNL